MHVYNFPSSMLCGEVVTSTLEFVNVGLRPIRSIYLTFNRPELFSLVLKPLKSRVTFSANLSGNLEKVSNEDDDAKAGKENNEVVECSRDEGRDALEGSNGPKPAWRNPSLVYNVACFNNNTSDGFGDDDDYADGDDDGREDGFSDNGCNNHQVTTNETKYGKKRKIEKIKKECFYTNNNNNNDSNNINGNSLNNNKKKNSCLKENNAKSEKNAFSGNKEGVNRDYGTVPAAPVPLSNFIQLRHL